MTRRHIEEVAANVWRWERDPRGLRPGEFGGRTSYAVMVENELLLVDPLVDGDQDPVLDVLDDLVRTRVRILVTMPYHARSTAALCSRYRRATARIYGHPAIRTRLAQSCEFEAVTGEDGVAGLARFHSIGRPPRSQQAIEIPAVHALAFGDAIVETGNGELRVWDAPLDSDQRQRWWQTRYLPTLQRLAELDINHVLVTHGQPVIGGGGTALRRALEKGPWQRPTLS